MPVAQRMQMVGGSQSTRSRFQGATSHEGLGHGLWFMMVYVVCVIRHVWPGIPSWAMAKVTTRTQQFPSPGAPTSSASMLIRRDANGVLPAMERCQNDLREQRLQMTLVGLMNSL